jgi:hypothetical protein
VVSREATTRRWEAVEGKFVLDSTSVLAVRVSVRARARRFENVDEIRRPALFFDAIRAAVGVE